MSNIIISTTEPHHGNDLKIVAYNPETFKAQYAFIHRAHNSSNEYESSVAGNSLRAGYNGSLVNCVRYTVGMLARSIASPSPSEKIREEVERQVELIATLDWNPEIRD